MARALLIVLALTVAALAAYTLLLRADNAALRADSVISAAVIAGQNATIRLMDKTADATERVTIDWSGWHAGLTDLSPQVAAAIQGATANESDKTQHIGNIDFIVPADIAGPLRRMCDQARASAGAGAGDPDAAGSVHAVPGDPRPCGGFDGLTLRGLARLTARLYEHAGREGADKRAMRAWVSDMGTSN